MKQVIKINASSLPLSKCVLSWYDTIISGYKQVGLPAAVVYGIAFHKFMDTMFKTEGHLGKAKDAALAAFRVPKFENRLSPHLSSELHLLPTCFNYWEDVASKDAEFKICMMPDGKPATEVTFEIPYYEDEQFIVILCGTIDKIGQIVRGCFSIGDYKTTSTRDVLPYLDDYEHSPQLKFYILSLKLMAEKYPTSMLGQIGATRVGAFIDGVFLRPKVMENEYRRSKVFIHPNEVIADFRLLLDAAIQRLLQHIRDNTWDRKEGMLNGACEQKFSKCWRYFVCRAQNREIEQLKLKKDFIQKEYDPLHHND